MQRFLHHAERFATQIVYDHVNEVDLSQRDDAHLDRLGDADGHPRPQREGELAAAAHVEAEALVGDPDGPLVAEVVRCEDGLVAAAGLGGLTARAPDSVLWSPGVRTRFGLPRWV